MIKISVFCSSKHALRENCGSLLRAHASDGAVCDWRSLVASSFSSGSVVGRAWIRQQRQKTQFSPGHSPSAIALSLDKDDAGGDSCSLFLRWARATASWAHQRSAISLPGAAVLSAEHRDQVCRC